MKHLYEMAKKYFDIANVINFLAVNFWILETIFFLIRDGWHWKAISPEEKLVDKIVGFFFVIAFTCSCKAGLLFLEAKITEKVEG